MRSRRLTVEREGVLTLSAEICEAAGLRPGDILAVETDGGDFFLLEIYRELLHGAWEYMDDGALWGFVARFLSRPLTAIEPGGHVRIPEQAFPLPVGSEVSLYVDQQGSGHLLQFCREP